MLKLRSFLFYSVYAILTISFGILCLPLFLIPRRWAEIIVVYWNPIALKLLSLCCGIHFNISGNINALPRPCVVVANHQSPLETLFLQWHCRPISAVLKKQLLYIPFFGWGLKLTQPIGIDRNHPTQAIKQIKTLGLARLQSGKNILIFPEGTRMPPGEIGNYMRSAADVAKQANVPIVPIAHNCGCFWLNKKFIKIPGKVSVVVGDPIDLSEQNTKAAMQAIQEWTEQQLKTMS